MVLGQWGAAEEHSRSFYREATGFEREPLRFSIIDPSNELLVDAVVNVMPFFIYSYSIVRYQQGEIGQAMKGFHYVTTWAEQTTRKGAHLPTKLEESLEAFTFEDEVEIIHIRRHHSLAAAKLFNLQSRRTLKSTHEHPQSIQTVLIERIECETCRIIRPPAKGLTVPWLIWDLPMNDWRIEARAATSSG